jgi:outer membrane protein TolC
MLSQKIGERSHEHVFNETPHFKDIENVFIKLLPKNHTKISGDEARLARVSLAESEIEANKAAWGTQFDLVAKTGFSYAVNTDVGSFNQTPFINVALEITTPLYDGSTHSHAMAASFERKFSVEKHNQAELHRALEDLKELNEVFKTNEQSIANYYEASLLAQNTVEGLEAQFKMGANTIFEYLSGVENKLNMDTQYINAKHQKIKSMIEMSVIMDALTLENVHRIQQEDKVIQ